MEKKHPQYLLLPIAGTKWDNIRAPRNSEEHDESGAIHSNELSYSVISELTLTATLLLERNLLKVFLLKSTSQKTTLIFGTYVIVNRVGSV